MSTFNPIQSVGQELIGEAVTIDEQLAAANPTAIPAVTWEQKNKLAGELWLAAGGVQDSPLTLDFWLQAEILLATETP